MTYITERVMAMSFPASGFESMYRNSIQDVVTYLDGKHEGHYKIYNMSGRNYNQEKFEGRVENYDWEDHHSPTIDVLFRACDSMY
jgi:phosphatidylinositol-3,4,5-trisphosphate 3-phosphatase/dual-specificity protein phosphatase PTEN